MPVFFCLLTFIKISFLKKFFMEYHHDQCQMVWIQIRSGNVVPDLGPNCLQRLSADNKSRSRVKGVRKIVIRLITVKTLIRQLLKQSD